MEEPVALEGAVVSSSAYGGLVPVFALLRQHSATFRCPHFGTTYSLTLEHHLAAGTDRKVLSLSFR